MWASAVDQNAKHAPAFISAVDRYVKQNPKDPQSAKLGLRAAKAELKYGNKSSAMLRLDRLIRNYPRTPESSDAVHASLDILNKSGDLVNLSLKARSWMLSIESWAEPKEKSKLRAELAQIVVKADAKSCESIATKDGSEIEAALCYQSFGRSTPDTKLASKSLLLAADYFDKGKDSNGAIAALELVVQLYPNSESAVSAFSRLATYYEKTFQFDRAIVVYSKLVRSNSAGENRNKILHRLLSLLHGLGRDSELERLLSDKETPASIRKDFAGIAARDRFIALKREEQIYGYSNGSLASARARELFGVMNTSRYSRNLSSDQKIDLARMQALMALSREQFSKAGREFSRGMKIFRSSSKYQAVWDAGARLRLAELGMLEIQFNRTNVKTRPSQKVALFSRLDRSFAEILKMNSPAIALDALAASSRVYQRMAEDIKVAGATPAQVAAYEGRAVETRRILGMKAREWKIITPGVVAAYKGKAGFPWFDLPRWLELSKEQEEWDEWEWSDAGLMKAIEKNTRSDSRRAAFVLLARKNSLGSPQLSAAVNTFTDRQGIQARIQAMLQDGEVNRASLFLKQYESQFGADAFSEHHLGRVDWLRGLYTAAYSRWTKTRYTQDFKVAYWTQGWTSLMDYLIYGRSSPNRKSAVYAQLSSLAKAQWQKVYLAELCLLEAMDCVDEYSNDKILSTLKEDIDGVFSVEFADNRSAWSIKKVALAHLIDRSLRLAQNKDDLRVAKRALSEFEDLRSSAKDKKSIDRESEELSLKIDRKISELEEAQKKLVAGVGL